MNQRINAHMQCAADLPVFLCRYEDFHHHNGGIMPSSILPVAAGVRYTRSYPADFNPTVWIGRLALFCTTNSNE